MNITRRDFLKTGVLSAGAAAAGWSVVQWPSWLPRLAFRTPPDASYAGDTLVCIFQRGGMDGLNVVVPHGDGDYYRHRSTLAIPQPKAGDAQAALDLDGFFGLHPALAPLKELYDQGALAVVQAAGSPDPTHSHFDAMDYMERGTPGEKAIPTGWLGRHLQTAAAANQSPFRAVGLGAVMQASLRGPVPAVALQSIADFHLRGRPGAAAEITRFQAALAAMYGAGNDLVDDGGRQALAALDTLSALVSPSAPGPATGPGPTPYRPANGAAYPNTMFGKAMATVAQLIKAQVGLEVACVDIGGWDTHVGEGGAADGQLPRLLRELGATLAAFYTDLQDRMGRITLVTMSEFGRRVQENGSHGTDHGHGNCMFLLGGGVQGGKVYGDWPGLAANAMYGPGDLAITTDFRDVLAEIVQKRLLNGQLAAVFPDYTPRPRGILRDVAPASSATPTARLAAGPASL